MCEVLGGVLSTEAGVSPSSLEGSGNSHCGDSTMLQLTLKKSLMQGSAQACQSQLLGSELEARGFHLQGQIANSVRPCLKLNNVAQWLTYDLVRS